MADDTQQFEGDKREWAAAMAADPEVAEHAAALIADVDRHNWTYQWTWLGLPVIQLPPDVIALQEVIWKARPQLVVETGVARGGSLILSASVLHALGEGRVLGIDIDIRAHNRAAIEAHPLAHRIDLVEGSSVDEAVVADAAARAAAVERTMVILDSNHTHEHVLAELRAYAPLVSPGQYLVVADTVVEHLPPQTHRPRPWGVGDNPATALTEYLEEDDSFEVDGELDRKLLLTSSPGGYLRRRA